MNDWELSSVFIVTLQIDIEQQIDLLLYLCTVINLLIVV